MNSILTEFYDQLPEAEEGTFAYVKNQKRNKVGKQTKSTFGM